MHARSHRHGWAIALGSVIVPALIWIATFQRIAYEREDAIEEATRETENLAIALEEHSNWMIQGMRHILIAARREYLRQGRSMGIADILADVATIDQEHPSLGLFDENGDVVFSTAVPATGLRPDPETFAAHRDHPSDALRIGKPSQDAVSGEISLEFSKRISKADGSFGGMVTASIAAHAISDFYRQAGLGPRDVVAIIGKDGITRVRRAGNKLSGGQDARSARVWKQAGRQPQGTFRSQGTFEGVTRFISYRTSARYPIILSVGRAESDVLAGFEDARRRHLTSAAVATALQLFLGLALIVVRRRNEKTRAALEYSESQFRATFDQAFVGMMRYAADGRPLQVNQTLCEMLGYPREELLKRPLRDFVHPEDAASLPAADEGASLASRTKTHGIRFLRKDGEAVWSKVATTAVRDPDGGPDAFVTVVHDVSDLKRLDRLKSEFVSMVSHELRTPLTSIRGSLGLIAGGVTGAIPEATKNMVEIAKTNCERLIRLINDILDSEKIESGKMQFELQEVAVEPLVRRAIADNHGFARQRDVRLELRADADLGYVVADPDRLIQVLTNLLSNAVKFSPAGAAVDVELSRRGTRVRFEVRDHGPGIPDEFRGGIFQKFSQADNSAQAKAGTGLGLNISKALVEKMGGTIGFNSARGIGTTFFFELPAALAPGASLAHGVREYGEECPG
jgi:PAS domain S-box-containing protein